jgi:hypothetical protein
MQVASIRPPISAQEPKETPSRVYEPPRATLVPARVEERLMSCAKTLNLACVIMANFS